MPLGARWERGAGDGRVGWMSVSGEDGVILDCGSSESGISFRGGVAFGAGTTGVCCEAALLGVAMESGALAAAS